MKWRNTEIVAVVAICQKLKMVSKAALLVFEKAAQASSEITKVER